MPIDVALFILTDDTEFPGLEIIFKAVSIFCISLTSDVEMKGKVVVDRLGHKTIKFSLGGDSWITADEMSFRKLGKEVLGKYTRYGYSEDF